MKRLLALTAALLAAAVAGFLTSASASPTAHQTTIATFSDSVGESAGAPDISTVNVDLDGTVLTLVAQVAGMPELSTDGTVMFMLNTDSNPATGRFGGADYVLFLDVKTLSGAVLQWKDGDYAAAAKVADPSRMLIGSSSAGFTFDLANLGSPKHIEFSMMVVKGTLDTGSADLAPDSGFWAFEAVVPAPPAPTPTPPPKKPEGLVVKPVIGSPVVTPAFVAGKRVTVTFPVSRSDTAKPLTTGKLVCDPSIAGKVLPHAESFTAGKARLSFGVPASAKGKVLKVKVTITSGGQSATKVVSFRVR